MKGNAADWLALFVSPLNYKAKSLLTIVNNNGNVRLRSCCPLDYYVIVCLACSIWKGNDYVVLSRHQIKIIFSINRNNRIRGITSFLAGKPMIDPHTKPF